MNKFHIKRPHLLTLLTLALSISIFPNLNAQNSTQTDSVTVSKIISDFYSWYINSIKGHMDLDYQPGFIENTEGNTTLDFDNYIKNLKKYEFSDSIIQNEIFSYQDCLNKLATVKFSDFKKKVFVDLDEFEQFKCDFSNYYRWIGGQEICDGVKIDVMKFTGDKRCEVSIKKYTLTDDKDYFWWSHAIKIKCIRTHNNWKINSIETR
jgi:hypothetical protein